MHGASSAAWSDGLMSRHHASGRTRCCVVWQTELRCPGRLPCHQSASSRPLLRVRFLCAPWRQDWAAVGPSCVPIGCNWLHVPFFALAVLLCTIYVPSSCTRAPLRRPACLGLSLCLCASEREREGEGGARGVPETYRADRTLLELQCYFVGDRTSGDSLHFRTVHGSHV